VEPHQPVAPRPVQLQCHRIARGKPGAGANGVDDPGAVLAGLDHGPPGDGAAVALLAAREGIEDGLFERHDIAVGSGDAGLQPGAVRVLPEHLAGHRTGSLIDVFVRIIILRSIRRSFDVGPHRW